MQSTVVAGHTTCIYIYFLLKETECSIACARAVIKFKIKLDGRIKNSNLKFLGRCNPSSENF